MIEDAPEEQLLLTDVDILEGLPQSEMEYLAKRSQIVRLGRKENLNLGGNHRGILLLVSGRVRVHEPAFRRQDLTFSVAEGGTVVGQPGSALRPSRTLRVEALEPSVLRILGWEHFEDSRSAQPQGGAEDHSPPR
jgi:hypothetical protein